MFDRDCLCIMRRVDYRREYSKFKSFAIMKEYQFLLLDSHKLKLNASTKKSAKKFIEIETLFLRTFLISDSLC